MRLVLDSNVWLDWLIFDDPGVQPLKQAQHDGLVEIVIDPPCRDELVRVVAYERFGLDQITQATLLGNVDRLSTRLDQLRYPAADLLPRCSDPDDMKFLALSAAGGADWLITKDNALLATRRKQKRTETAYRVATPQQWSSAQGVPPSHDI
jgi:putative PIN family toxin of toxin-antitoxin system